jgi:hypothetical protein
VPTLGGARENLAKFSAWIQASSQSYPTPLALKKHARGEESDECVERGPYTLIIPRDLALAPLSDLHPEHAPVYIPEQTAFDSNGKAVVRLPDYHVPPPVNQDLVRSRLRAVVWTARQDEVFSASLVPLTNPAETLQSALDRAFPFGLNLGRYLTLFIPVYLVSDANRPWFDSSLPFHAETSKSLWLED